MPMRRRNWTGIDQHDAIFREDHHAASESRRENVAEAGRSRLSLLLTLLVVSAISAWKICLRPGLER